MKLWGAYLGALVVSAIAGCGGDFRSGTGSHGVDAGETGGTDTGNGGFTHHFFRVSRSAEEQVADRDAIAEWARMTYGWMGRSPDYKAAFLATLGANADFYDPYQENARRWYKESQEKVL